VAASHHRSPVGDLRVTPANDRPIGRGSYVLYWMIAARRTRANFALDHALSYCKSLDVPLVIFEPLRAGYAWASDRHHTFVMQGMADNAAACAKAGITYLPYVEPEPGAGAGLLEALAAKACVVVTDEQPGFFLPRMVTAAAERLAVRVEMVDGNGVLPLRAVDKAYPTAASFRRQLQKILPPHLATFPALALKPPKVARDAPAPKPKGWSFGIPKDCSQIVIDHSVGPVSYRGGAVTAGKVLDAFIDTKLSRYHEDRSEPDADVASGLSPYLHFGHISTHEIVARVWESCDWDVSRLAGAKVTGSREGWWDAPPHVESFLDELITWRELGYVFCHHRKDYAQWTALPPWARATLDEHAKDPRPHLYTRAQMEAASTGDDIWNAAQRELVAEGRIQNYLRMLWGKKILEWSPSPKAALATLIELNNKYAVDGRDPNSYSGIFWTLGLFDRPWGPVRPIFGTIRYMSSDSTRRKLKLKNYLAHWGGKAGQLGLAI